MMDFLGGLGSFAGDMSDRLAAASLNAKRIDNPEKFFEADERDRVLRERQMQRDALLNNPAMLGRLNQIVPNAEEFLRSGGELETLGTFAKLNEPTPFETNMRTMQQVSQMPPEMRELYAGLFGKGGVNVNVNNKPDSAFNEKFKEEMGKKSAEQIAELDKEAADYASQVRSAEQAFAMLQANPDIEISPLAPVKNTVKSALSGFLTEDELKNVSDYQTLDSQLIRNRFDVTKVLKGAITEQEQQAAQTVAGKPTGTRLGLEQTLKNNAAFGALQQDYAERKREYIAQAGESYSPKKFEQYYKELGERGERPTLDALLGGAVSNATKPIKAGSRVKWGDF